MSVMDADVMAAYRAARLWAHVHGHPQPDDRMIDAALRAVPPAPAPPGTWRVGGKVGRNIYLDDVEVAVAVGAEGTAAALARAIVAGMNATQPVETCAHGFKLEGPARAKCPIGCNAAAPSSPVPSPRCGATGPDGVVCQRKPGHGPALDESAHHGGYAASGELVRW